MESLLKFFCGWFKDGLLRGLATLTSLEEAIHALQKEMRELRGAREDVQREVDEAEMEQQLECRGEVKEWLKSVEDMDHEVAAIAYDFDKGSGCAGVCSPGSWWSSYQLAARAAGKLEEVRDLKRRRGELGAVARKPLPAPVVEMPMPTPQIVGKGSEFEEILGYLGREDVGVIGIYGAEGIGKTILLKRINNEFALETCGFSVVVFIEISQKMDLERIQIEIGDRIGLPLLGDQRAKALARALSRRTFLLLLDDVPQELAFGDIGIPLPTRKNRCKIVLTAREEQVCVNMGAQQRVRVDTLDDDEAWRLFCMTVGSNQALHLPEVTPHAQTIVKNCRGLPLAIITMGRTMATKRSLLDWERGAASQEIPGKILALVGPPNPTVCAPLNTSSRRDPPEIDDIPQESRSEEEQSIIPDISVEDNKQHEVFNEKHAERPMDPLEADKQCKSPDGYEKQRENEDLLIRCIAQPLGFTAGRPTAACLIYICVYWWKSLEADEASIFDRVIQTIGTAIQEQEDRAILVYWLSNVFTLLLLIQQGQKPGHAVAKDEDHYVESTNLFWRMARGIEIALQSVTSGEDASSCQVKAKYPVLLFKQRLIAYVEKIYGIIRDNFKQELSPLLSLVIQASRTSRLRPVRGRSRANVTANEASLRHWHEIFNSLENLLKTMRDNYVAPVLVRKMFVQIFWLINVHLFNSILLRRESCSFSNGEYIQAGLSDLESWCTKATDEFAGSAWDELKHVRQAVLFLVIHQKGRLTFNELTQDHCPILSVQQIYRISTLYWDDVYETKSVSSDVLATLREHMVEDSNKNSSGSFILDDDSSVPFSFEELSKSIAPIEVPYIKPPQLLRENSGFMQLFRDSD